MEYRDLRQKLFVIVFELTTPLASLSGFCDLMIQRTKSQFVMTTLNTIKQAVEHIKGKKDLIREKIIDENDPDFRLDTKAANYLQRFASEAQNHKNTISTLVNQLLEHGFDTGDPSLDDWAMRISTAAAENLSLKLEALMNIQSVDLKLKIPPTSEE
jgi:signal transduction histidine kinase